VHEGKRCRFSPGIKTNSREDGPNNVAFRGGGGTDEVENPGFRSYPSTLSEESRVFLVRTESWGVRKKESASWRLISKKKIDVLMERESTAFGDQKAGLETGEIQEKESRAGGT